jgi:hypothetical protein
MRCIAMSVLLIASLNSFAYGTVTTFENRAAWQTTIGDYTNITFQGFPEHTLISTQYAGLGVVFPDGNDVIEYHQLLLNDGIGLKSSDLIYGTIHMSFAQPMYGVAVDFLGIVDIQLYSSGQLIYSSPTFSDVSGPFAGLLSTVPFDAAVIRDPSDGVVVIDDLYFGPPIPAPSGFAIFALAPLIQRRRRSRR